jgi:hypothetical protein
MSKTYSKADVSFHSDGFRDRRPAVNVKVHRSLYDLVLPLPDTNPHLTREWIESHLSDDDLDWLFWHMCETEMEMIEQDAKEIFGSHVTVEQEGRSGGWVIVVGLDDVDEWDAVALAKWRKFAKYARNIADGIPEQMVYCIELNEFEQWKNQ